MKQFLLLSFFFFISVSSILGAPSLSAPESVSVNGSFLLKNNGDVTLTGITLASDTSSIAIGFDTSIFTQSLLIQQLLVGETKQIFTQTSSTGKNRGSLIATSDQNATLRINVGEDIGQKLIIDKVRIKSQKDKDTIELGDSVKVDAGEKINIKVTLKNLFEESIDIEKISLEVIIKDIDNGDNLDYEESLSSLRHNDEEDIEFDIVLPIEVLDDTYDVDIIAEGEDERGVDHKAKFSFNFNVEKPSHDLRISSATLEPTILTCTKETTLHATIKNVGRSEERKAAITINSLPLSLDYAKYDLILDEDSFDETSEYEVNLAINALDKTLGSYDIIINAYRDDTKLEDEKKITLSIEECVTTQQSVVPRVEGLTFVEPRSIPPVAKDDSDNGSFFPVLVFVVLIGACLITLLFIILALKKH